MFCVSQASVDGIDPLLVNYVAMLCCCFDYHLSEAPLTPLFGLNWYVPVNNFTVSHLEKSIFLDMETLKAV